MKRHLITLTFLLLFRGAPSLAQATAPILPRAFAGWNQAKAQDASPDPAAADRANAAVLKEYGFKDVESAAYTRDDGRKLALRAARFEDATGAYGAFTFYKDAAMLTEKIGDQGASLNNRVLFYRGNVLVDAVFDGLSSMSAAELRELAGMLPQATGAALNLPALPTYLPKQSYIRNSAKFVLGPVGLGRINAPLSADLVLFAASPEVVLGRYNTSAGEGTLVLISYPTPQIAAERLRTIEAAHPGGQPAGDAGANEGGRLYARRTGPIVVAVAGTIPESEAKALLASVNYDANVTWNENTSSSESRDLAKLLVNIIILCGILVAIGLVAGVAFGGIRVLALRVFPHAARRHEEEAEFISLHLSEPVKGPKGMS